MKSSFFLRDNIEANRVRSHLLRHHPRTRFTISPHGEGPGPFGGTGERYMPPQDRQGRWEIWGSQRVIDIARALVDVDPEWQRHIHARHVSHLEYEQSLVALRTLTQPSDDNDANARLIAAAPELLKALQDLSSTYLMTGDHVDGHHGDDCVLCNAHAAIKAAQAHK